MRQCAALKKTSPEPITEEQLAGYQTVRKFRRLIDAKLAARPAGQVHPSESDPRRKLGGGDFLALLLFALYNPVLKSMRAIVTASHFEKVRDSLDVSSVSLGSFSETQHMLDPELLREVFQDLSARLAFKPKSGDPRLEVFVERMVAADGSFFAALPRMSWAVYRPEGGNCKVKLHLLFESLRGGIADARVTAGNVCERKALKKMIRAGKLYVGDRYYGMEYDYFDCFEEKKADFAFRIKANAVYEVLEERAVSADAAAYGVVGDQLVRFPHASKSSVWRLVTVHREDKEFLLLTNRLDIDAEVVGMLYRHRWEVELFFKWLKCILKCQHFLLESPHGVAIQIYTALILALLLSSLTGKKPTQRQMEAIQLHLMGYCSEAELEKSLFAGL